MTSKDAVRNRILRAAVEAIDAGGDSAVRVVAVCEEAGVTQGMVRYYFGDRAGLLAEAKAVRFGERFGDLIDAFADTAVRCKTQDELRAVIDEVLRQVFSPERSLRRLERNIDIGGALGQELLAHQIAASRDAVCRELAAAFEALRDRGLVRKDADVLMISALYFTFVHGYSMWELGESTVDRLAIIEMFKASIYVFLFD